MAKYKFIGEGLGVPGLPHELTDEEAKALGDSGYLDEDGKTISMHQVLMQAVKAGNYKKLGPKKE
jgi:hypothetical protein